MSVYYLGFYARDNGIDEMYVSLSAVNKMNYIINTLVESGIRTEIVSSSWPKNGNALRGSQVQLGEHLYFRRFASLGTKSRVGRAINRAFIKTQMFAYFMVRADKNDIVIAYHSLFYGVLLQMIKRIKKYHLILEVEELYSDVSGNEKHRKKELNLCKYADAFVFPTRLLDEKLNFRNTPSVLIHGTYQDEPKIEEKRNDTKIHVVYAGTFDPRKGGAAAAAAAEYLDEKYHIHIIGFGSESDKEHLFKVIDETKKKTKCGLTYDGLLSGEEYIRFIQSCDIGLSTQNPDAAFNATSFPSKVLSYMTNDLRVVSIRIKAVERSAVGDLITYYDEQTPKSIAEAIKSIDFSKPYDSRARIRELNAQFQQDIRKLIEAVNEVH